MTGTDESANRGTTRRTAIKLFGGLAGAGGAAALGLGAFGGSGRATVDDDSFTAADVELSSDDGSVTDVWLRPDLTYSWDGLNSPPDSVGFTVEVETPALNGDYEVLGSEDDADVSGGTSAADAYEFDDRLSLLDGAWTAADFQPSAGETAETGPIHVRVTAELRNADDAAPYTDSASAQFSVVVTDEAVEFGGDGTGVGGDAGTGGSAGDGSGGPPTESTTETTTTTTETTDTTTGETTTTTGTTATTETTTTDTTTTGTTTGTTSTETTTQGCQPPYAGGRPDRCKNDGGSQGS